jgi:DNA-binding NarL/FixJ family response regulator
MKKLDILIADDHDLVLQGFIFMVKSFPFVGSAIGVNNGKGVLKHLKNHHPDILITDLNMPEMDGIETSQYVLNKYPDIKIIVLSGFNDDNMIYDAIEMGINGYLLKDTKPEELKQAIHDVMAKGFYYNESVVNIMRKGIIKDSTKPGFQPLQELTEREKQILKLLCQEKTTKEIADEVFLSDRTIEKIRKNLANKLEVKGTVGLVKYAIKNGLDI